jgi:hypothetical protein
VCGLRDETRVQCSYDKSYGAVWGTGKFRDSGRQMNLFTLLPYFKTGGEVGWMD